MKSPQECSHNASNHPKFTEELVGNAIQHQKSTIYWHFELPTLCVGGVIDENIGNLAKKSESLILEILWIYDFSSNNDSLACGSLFYWFSSDAKSSDDKKSSEIRKFYNF